MEKRDFFPLLQGACFMLISLFLQNCGGSDNLTIQSEEKLSTTGTIEQENEQGRRKRARIEIDQEQGSIEQGQEIRSFDILPPEIWQYIFSYLDFEGILSARTVNRDWNQLITGYREAGVVGVENKPAHIIDTGCWVKRKEIDFRSYKLRELTPATIPSFAFYYLMGDVNSLPQSFWPYLEGTNVHILNLGGNQIGYLDDLAFAIALADDSAFDEGFLDTSGHTLDLSHNQIGNQGVIEFARYLQGTQVHTLYLGWSKIGDSGVIELAKALPATRVHTLNLFQNEIGAAGAIALIKSLPATRIRVLNLSSNRIGAIERVRILPAARVHTLDLKSNQIGDEGAREFAKVLLETQVHTLDLSHNQIGDAEVIELAKALSATRVRTLNLRTNRIGAQGAQELAKALQGTQLYRLDLQRNQIGGATQQLLVKQYPHIKWAF
jgi:hypothetical protein